MKEKQIVDLYMDDREFRNYINTMLRKHGYVRFTIDDTRVSDEDMVNDNDIKVSKDNMRYAVQTYLNKEITNNEIVESLVDMEKENLNYGLIVTNTIVNDEIRKKALESHIRILDRNDYDNVYDEVINE